MMRQGCLLSWYRWALERLGLEYRHERFGMRSRVERFFRIS